MPLNFPFDFKNPDYNEVFQHRIEVLKRIGEDKKNVHALMIFYKNNPAQFIIDWGMTFDPRNVERGLPSLIPFILFPKQEEWINWFIERWKKREPGITEKSRDMGISWLTIALGATLCLFNDNVVAGYGSRKEEYVDHIGDPKSLFFKARQFISNIPSVFTGYWSEKKHSSYMRIVFPITGSRMIGEAGDNIGRGDRTSFTIVDESAWLQRPELVEASLSQTTNCRQDVSTPHGLGNPFARKRFSGEINVFTFHWRDDPRKDDEWYEKKKKDIGDSVVIAQELDLNYSASLDGIVIPATWVMSSIDAHIKLNMRISGEKIGALDIADEGKDLNAFCCRYGILVEHIEQWSGKGDDIYGSIEKACDIADTWNYKEVYYDADGLGSGVRGDSRKINEERISKKLLKINFNVFRGSASVIDPDYEMIEGRKNIDFFENLKAQAWWSLRVRFQNTYRAVEENQPYDQDSIISISSSAFEKTKLISELSQPTFTKSKTGKLMIDKKPDSTRSPNLADAVMMAFSPKERRGFLSDF
jgi:phage terminase large subunit